MAQRTFNKRVPLAALALGWLGLSGLTSAADPGLPPVRQDSAIQLLNERKDEVRQQQID